MANRFNGVNVKRRIEKALLVKRCGELLIRKKSNREIAFELGVDIRTVQRYVADFLASGTRFPASLSPTEVNELRQLEAEALECLNQKIVTAVTALEHDPNVSLDRKVFVLARALSARARSNERLAAMFGLDQPTKVVEESMRLRITEHQGTVKVTFDESQIAPDYSIDSGLREIGSDGIARRCKLPDLPNLLGGATPPGS